VLGLDWGVLDTKAVIEGVFVGAMSIFKSYRGGRSLMR
jgi:hypothetical protein